MRNCCEGGALSVLFSLGEKKTFPDNIIKMIYFVERKNFLIFQKAFFYFYISLKS